MTEQDLPLLEGSWAKPLNGGAPKQLVVFLHGVGADGHDLITLAHEMAPALPDAQFVSPHAPFDYDMAPMGKQWFSLQEPTAEKLLEGVRAAEPILNRYLDDQLGMYNVPESQLILVGFSQGTMLALHTMLRRANPCGALVAFSGAMIGAETLANEINARPPVCLIHGDMDEVVPFEAMALASEVLLAHGVPHETHACQHVGHGISPEGIMHMLQFIRAKLALPAAA